MTRLIIGLTGGIGSGKTAVSDYFASLGIDVVDADVIARTITNDPEVLKQLQATFGNEIIQDGQLNRAALRAFVFNNPAMTAKLNAITHPKIRQEITKQLSQATSDYVILSVPLLLESTGESSLAALCDRILVVDVPVDTQIERASQRDGQSTENIQAIINRQIDRESRLKLADDIVDNRGTLAQLYQQLDQLHTQYINLAHHLDKK